MQSSEMLAVTRPYFYAIKRDARCRTCMQSSEMLAVTRTNFLCNQYTFYAIKRDARCITRTHFFYYTSGPGIGSKKKIIKKEERPTT